MRVFEFDCAGDTSQTLELKRTPVETEWQLESWLHANPEVILDEPLLIFGRQYGLETGIPDLLALDQWGNVVVVELKRGQSGSGSASEETILSQPQNYAQSLSRYEYEDLDGIYSEYKTALDDGKWDVGESVIREKSLAEAHEAVFGGPIDRTAFNGYQRMVILAEEITSRTENNARYLLEQGLSVQCIEVSSTVVDYPLSRVRPERSAADFSNLTGTICDRITPRVRSIAGVEEIRSTPTKVIVESASPSGLRYEVYVPGNEAGRQVYVRINASKVSDGDVDAIRVALKTDDESQGTYRVANEGKMDLVNREPISIERKNSDSIEGVAGEVVSLIEWAQPRLEEQFGPSD